MAEIKLTSRNYHSRKMNAHFMSVSQFKSFSQCAHRAIAEIKGKYKREETTALLVGSFVDAYFSGELPFYQAEHPELFKRDGSLKAEYIHAQKVIERMRDHGADVRVVAGKAEADALVKELWPDEI